MNASYLEGRVHWDEKGVPSWQIEKIEFFLGFHLTSKTPVNNNKLLILLFHIEVKNLR